jgi:hypothetical protein
MNGEAIEKNLRKKLILIVLSISKKNCKKLTNPPFCKDLKLQFAEVKSCGRVVYWYRSRGNNIENTVANPSRTAQPFRVSLQT